MPIEPTLEDLAIDVYRILEDSGDEFSRYFLPWPTVSGLCRRLIAAEAERDRLHAILDAPCVALFADGREPTTNERHLLNLLSWREKEAAEAKAEIARLQSLYSSLADRVAAQAEVLARRAEGRSDA